MGISIILGGIKIMENKEIEDKLSEVLAQIYLEIPWRRIGVKSSYKFFIDRVRASNNTKNFKEFLDVLTRKCNVEFVKLDVDDMKFLEENNSTTMMLLRKETLYITNYAIMKVQEFKDKKRG